MNIHILTYMHLSSHRLDNIPFGKTSLDFWRCMHMWSPFTHTNNLCTVSCALLLLQTHLLALIPSVTKRYYYIVRLDTYTLCTSPIDMDRSSILKIFCRFCLSACVCMYASSSLSHTHTHTRTRKFVLYKLSCDMHYFVI